MSGRQYKDLLLFLGITFLLPLISVYLQNLAPNAIVKFILYGVEAAAPSIAAIIIIVKNKKITLFFRKNFRTKRIITALILPVVIAFLTMFLAKIIACFLLKEKLVLCNISIMQWVVIMWALIAEEFGWRGYLQPFLHKQMKHTYLVPFVVGTIWCLWHYHYFLFGDVQVPLIWFFISCIVESYIYSYLLSWSDCNLLSAMMYHFAWNLFIHVFAINPVDNRGNALPYIILVVLEILICFCFMLQEKRLNKKQSKSYVSRIKGEKDYE